MIEPDRFDQGDVQQLAAGGSASAAPNHPGIALALYLERPAVRRVRAPLSPQAPASVNSIPPAGRTKRLNALAGSRDSTETWPRSKSALSSAGQEEVQATHSIPRATVLGVEHAGRFEPPADCLGGSEEIALLALEQLAGRGFRVLLACPGDTELAKRARSRGIPVSAFPFLPMRRTRDVRTILAYVESLARLGRKLSQLCRDERVDVVHAFSLISALYAFVGTLGAPRPLLVHAQDAQIPHPLRRVVLRVLAHNRTRFICVSHSVEWMLRDVGVPARKLSLVYNAVEPRFFEPDHERPGELVGRGPHVGFFSHILPSRGHHVFLDAAALVAKRFPSARFYLVGATAAGVADTYLEALQARVDQTPLAGRARMVGPRRDVAPWMAAMDVVVHASLVPEAFGLVIAEGMALGRPVVVADQGATRELVSDGETGYVAHAGDVEDLARVLGDALVRRNPEVGHRASAVAKARFTPELFGDALERVYESVL
jgi:glycosyltransferase involved in cell wall biosynthesis